MAKHPKAFDRLYCEDGERRARSAVCSTSSCSGSPNFMEKARAASSRIKGALIYPAVVIIIAVLIVTGIMYFVIPKFQEIFNDFDVELPGSRSGSSNAIAVGGRASSPDQAVPGAVWILLSPVLIFGLFKLIRMTGPGQAATDIVSLRIPVIGASIGRPRRPVHANARHAHLGGCADSRSDHDHPRHLGQLRLREGADQVHDSIREGETFAGPLRESKVCDPLVVNMIDVGEETGDLDIMLMKIADNYDEEVDVAVAAAAEPARADARRRPRWRRRHDRARALPSAREDDRIRLTGEVTPTASRSSSRESPGRGSPGNVP